MDAIRNLIRKKSEAYFFEKKSTNMFIVVLMRVQQTVCGYKKMATMLMLYN